MKVLIIVASGFLGEILLQKRKDNGWRAIIGGSLEMGETIEEAVAREVKEETGQIVTECQYVSSYYFEPKQLIMIGFIAYVKKSEFADSVHYGLGLLDCKTYK